MVVGGRKGRWASRVNILIERRGERGISASRERIGRSASLGSPIRNPPALETRDAALPANHVPRG